MNICVVGSGYVGLVTGACLADFGMNVVGVDKDRAKVEALTRGEVPIYEPGLSTLVEKNMKEGRLRFSTDLGPAIEEARAVFIAVGTPPRSDGSADLTFIREVAESIGEHLNGFKIIVTNDHGMRILGMRVVGEHASSAIQSVAYLIHTNQGIRENGTFSVNIVDNTGALVQPYSLSWVYNNGQVEITLNGLAANEHTLTTVGQV